MLGPEAPPWQGKAPGGWRSLEYMAKCPSAERSMRMKQTSRKKACRRRKKTKSKKQTNKKKTPNPKNFPVQSLHWPFPEFCTRYL